MTSKSVIDLYYRLCASVGLDNEYKTGDVWLGVFQ